MKVMILYNDQSGKNSGKELAKELSVFLKKKDNQAQIILQLTSKEVAPETIRINARRHEIDTLIIIGGDGTIHHVLQIFQKKIADYSVGIIPGGTVNNFARALQIPLKPKDAFEVILSGKERKVDYGFVNDTVIISTMTIGLLADTAVKISQQEKQRFGAFAFLRRFIQLLFKKKQYWLDIKTDNGNWQGKSQLLTVTMTNSAGGFTNFDGNARLDDGLFHMIILPKLNLLKFFVYLPTILRGKVAKIPDIKYLTPSKISISSTKKKVHTRTDGDPTDDLPVEMRVIKHGLRIIVPAQ